ncbi:MAG: hypothetical protein IPI67_28030 [Myxococcales bacterium]|nr:hypothetical protein [Myxococcales bacterium]
MSKARALSVLAASLMLLGAPACGPRRGTPRDAGETARQEAGQRLLGAWVLVSYQPETPLEPMFAGLLAAQMGTLVANFDGQNMQVSGTGVNTVRRYRVTQAAGDRLALVSYDDGGIPYDAVGEFRGGELWFESLTIPWRGRGVLRKVR